jgi:hypothetical protein
VVDAGKVMHNNISMVDLGDLAWLIEQNLKDINRRIEVLSKNNAQNQVQIAAAPNPVMADQGTAKVEEKLQGVGSSHHHLQGLDMNIDAMPKQHWFMNFMNNNNGDGGEETMPFGNVHHQNGFWPNLFFH